MSYFLRPRGSEEWVAVTKVEYLAAEQAEGFISGYGPEVPATFGFTGTRIEGTTRPKGGTP